MLYFAKFFFLLLIGVLVAPSAPGAIYGEDSRRDLFALNQSEWLRLSGSSVALISPHNMIFLDNQHVKIQGPSLSANERLCRGQQFENQPVVSLCSGVLISPSLVLTAGHCIFNEKQCRSTQFVFGVAFRTSSQREVVVSRSEIYSCAELIHSQHSNASQAVSDFAVIRLDRRVQGHAIASVDLRPVLPIGQPLIAFGYPNGIPMKFIGGRVRSNDPALSLFVTNLDSFDRNSGSPVFDVQTGKLEGIIVDGEEDFIRDGQCFRARHCSNDGCRGESVTRISEVTKWFHLTFGSFSP